MVARTRLNVTFVRNNRACKVEQKSRNERIQQRRKKLCALIFDLGVGFLVLLSSS